MKYVLACGALFFLALLAYSNSFHAGFTLDSNPLLLQDPRIQQATTKNVSLVFSLPYWWTPPQKGLYRPLTTMTYMFNAAVMGDHDQPAGYHEFNFLLHFVNVLLCYGLALTALRKFWPAAFTAAIWAVHPILVESVTNVIGRADLLAGFGVLAGLWAYWLSRNAKGARRIAWLACVMIASAIGIYSKESAICILGLIPLCEFALWKSEREPGGGFSLRLLQRGLFGLAAAAIPILIFLSQRLQVLAHVPLPQNLYVDNPLLGAGFWTARLTAVKVLARYLWLLAWPAKLSWNYYFAEIPLARGSVLDWIAWIAIAAVIAGVCWSYGKNRAVFFFAGFAFITLIPASNLLVLIGSIMADRFLYLPSIGFAACVVIGVYALGKKVGSPKFAPIVLGIFIAALGARTWVRNLDWQDDMSLLKAGVEDTPESFASHFAMATELYISDPSHANLDQVIAEADQSLAILGPVPNALNFGDAYANAGTYHQAKGDLLRRAAPGGQMTVTPESKLEYQRALQILIRGAAIETVRNARLVAAEVARGSDAAEIPWMGSKSLFPELALTLFRLGDLQDAQATAQNAAVIDPEQPKTFMLQGEILTAQNKKADAAVAYMEAYMTSGNGDALVPLSALYRGGLDTKGCAITKDIAGDSLNTACDTVHADICRAKAQLLFIYVAAHRQDLIDDMKSRTANLVCTSDSSH